MVSALKKCATVAEWLVREIHNHQVGDRSRDFGEFELIRGFFLLFIIALYRAAFFMFTEAKLRLCRIFFLNLGRHEILPILRNLNFLFTPNIVVGEKKFPKHVCAFRGLKVCFLVLKCFNAQTLIDFFCLNVSLRMYYRLVFFVSMLINYI